MLRGTTPTVVMTLPDDIDLSGADVAYLSFGQGGTDIFDLPIDRLTLADNVCTATLTQTETLSLTSGTKTQIQLRWKEGATAYGTKIVSVLTDAILKDGAI